MSHLDAFVYMFGDEIMEDKELLGFRLIKIKSSSRVFTFNDNGYFVNRR